MENLFFSESVFRRILPYLYGSEKCIEYPFTNDEGYGLLQDRVKGKKKHLLAHRVAYSLYYKELLTSNDIIMHSCDNPKCCNVFHLKKGTHLENVLDKCQKNRQAQGVNNGRYLNGNFTKEAKAHRKKKNEIKKFELERSSFKRSQIIEAKLMLSINVPLKEISQKTGIPYRTLIDIRRGKSYAHVST